MHCRAFMDELTVMTESGPGCRWILKGLKEVMEWARMPFNITGTAIPTRREASQELGKVFDCSLRGTTSIQSTCTELDDWLKSMDKSGLP